METEHSAKAIEILVLSKRPSRGLAYWAHFPLAWMNRSLYLFTMRSSILSYAGLTAFAVQAQAALAAQPLQFDLVCNVRGHVAADPQNRFPSEARTWQDHLHFVVDLRTRRFCEPWVCIHYGAARIAAVNAREITLYDQPLTVDSPAFAVTVRIRDGYYRERRESDDGYRRVETGICRRARFSGFPAGTRLEAPGTSH